MEKGGGGGGGGGGMKCGTPSLSPPVLSPSCRNSVAPRRSLP